MAILSKIRERSMFLIVIIGLALFAFVASPEDIMNFFNSSKVNSVGEVNGEVINRKEFGAEVEAYRSSVGGRVSQLQAVNSVWENIVSEKIYKEQLEKAGIVIGEKDVWDAIIQIPSIQNSPLFKNEIGLFDQEKFKEYLANIKEGEDNQSRSAWANWLQTEKNVKANLERAAYSNLIGVGLGASLKDGERKYFDDNTKISGQFVYLPFTSVPDSLVKVSKGEIESYIKAHASEFQVEESRDVKYVKFDVVASEEDEEAIKAELAKLIEDRDEYSSVVKATVKVEGFKNTTDNKLFVEENDSDLPLDDKFYFKNTLARAASDEIFKAKEGAVVGPYRDGEYFKLSKVAEIAQMPDSVQASHILIAYAGSRAGTGVTRTEEEAKKTADSILKIVKRNKSKFAAIAKKMSADKSNSDKGGKLDWFNYSRMVPEFRDFSFSARKGDIGIVKTIFGYHVVKIDNQKNRQKAVRLATVSRKIVASEATENSVFEEAETFAHEISTGKSFDELSKEKNYTVRPAIGLKALAENVPGLNRNRGLVIWSFNEDTNVGDTKRFDLDNGGYAVAVLTNKTKKGLSSVSKAALRVRPILVNEKKAAILNEKMSGTSLQDIAKENNTTVRSVSGLTLSGPTLSGVGREPGVVGAMSAIKEGEVVKGIVGVKGVFAVKVTKKELPTELPNYEALRKNIAAKNKNRTNQIYQALREAAEIEDNRSRLY